MSGQHKAIVWKPVFFTVYYNILNDTWTCTKTLYLYHYHFCPVMFGWWPTIYNVIFCSSQKGRSESNDTRQYFPCLPKMWENVTKPTIMKHWNRFMTAHIVCESESAVWSQLFKRHASMLTDDVLINCAVCHSRCLADVNVSSLLLYCRGSARVNWDPWDPLVAEGVCWDIWGPFRMWNTVRKWEAVSLL